MKTGFGTLVLTLFLGLLWPAIAVLNAADVVSLAKKVSADAYFKSGEPVDDDGFYQHEEDIEPNGISSGPFDGCPYEEDEEPPQPLLG